MEQNGTSVHVFVTSVLFLLCQVKMCCEEGLLFSVDLKQLSNHKTIIHDIMKFTYRVIICFYAKEDIQSNINHFRNKILQCSCLKC